MRLSIYSLFVAALGVFMASCSMDNYVAPNSDFKGRIVYKGEPINVESNQVRFQLWEPGWGKLAPIDVAITQEGNYSAVLFTGKYKMVFPRGEGPFMTNMVNATVRDTLYIDLKSSQTMDIEVMPYYMLRNASFSKGENKVTASCKIDKIITDANAKNIERVSLYINKTQFVSGANNIATTNIAGGSITDLSNLNLTVDIPTISPAQNYVFARIGVKISGVEDMIFSPVQKVQYK